MYIHTVSIRQRPQFSAARTLVGAAFCFVVFEIAHECQLRMCPPLNIVCSQQGITPQKQIDHQDSIASLQRARDAPVEGVYVSRIWGGRGDGRY